MYQVLARKYRPRNFNELVGQNHVSRALTSALDRGRLHHAYLFTGTRGVGKTTIARILAKCLNCETGVTSTPCEVCATCKAVNEGRFIDLIEIDAASRTKVEDTRELLDNVPYAPTQGRFKVYLIDEVHMLSTHSFNALLKTLEEPPEHVKFLFATTDPQKLPITVISRCLQFTLRPLAVDEITHHLTNILNKEEIQSEQDAIWQIAESAQGSLRDALSLTDQAIAYGQGAIHHQDVKEMLGLIDRTIIYDLILAIHQNQRERVSQLLLQFRQQALDVSLVLDQFISTLHELAMLQYLPDLSLKYSAEINQKIMTLSQLVSAQDLQLYYQIACKGRAELQLAVTQEQGFEMTVLRLLAFRPIQVNEVVVSQQQVFQQIESNVVIENSSSLNSAPLNREAVQALPVQEVQLQDSSSFDPDLEELEEQLAQQSVADPEPSSDDYLDEEVENSNDQFTNVQNENIQHLEQSENEQIVADVQSVTVNSETQQIQQVVQVEAAEPSLTLFGGEISPQPVVQDQTQDVFFLAPESDREIADSSVAVENTVQKHAQTVQQDHSQLESTQTQVTTTHAVQSSHHQTPQEILSLQPQILEGEWTVDKWEYWFRNSSLSPAVQELAQHGLMIGTINGQSTFQTSKQYENLLNQTQHDLEASLKQQWSSTVFNVQYGEVETITPFMMQRERKVRAFDRASEMLHQEPIVKSLMEAFDGQLENIQLK
ncbi:DNA polymerase III subunit gamma/tau [Acinetobacter wuhouensis]|uniref:DNA polymerase III subunit gamma/tau n=1 Tax=Acinetobacter wuhouensis TaxID=1879050 RepID=A0A4Q7AH35_9GAMM|nr:DNA polymerase III subunit gamma/tau [Acinetobacter wuhouensis]RZG47065.1 DNA polymerase III subunit gamma/tau [Acinetobacter wuhouensis]RZG70018.1 DNA polymerase III subunit gamma/tau [Acinetobacter wuhouensis]